MLMSMMMVSLTFYLMIFSSFHSLVFLLTMEFMVMMTTIIIIHKSTAWASVVMFMLISVCLNSYGVSLYVSMTRSKGFSYFFSF